MYTLALCDALSSQYGLPNLTPLAESVVREATYAPAPGDGQTANDAIHLVLKGQPGEIEAYLNQLERAMTRARVEAAIPGGNHVYLTCQQEGGMEAWRTRLLDGQVMPDPGGAWQRAHGGMGCTLTLRREDWWETLADPVLLMMQNAQGSNSGQALEISNHVDAEHSNLVDLPVKHGLVENVRGDLPAPASLVIGLSDPEYPYPVTFFAGDSWRPGTLSLSPAYPGESGVARSGVQGTVVSDANCAGGQALRLDWSGTQEQEIWGVTIPSGDAAILGGYPVLPLLRLQSALATGESAWYHWNIYALHGGMESLCAVSAGQAVEAGSQLISGPALTLPPWLVDQAYPFTVPDLRLALAVQMAGGGAHSLTLDSLSLMGLDGWRIYRPLTGQASSGISDDPPRGTLFRYREHSQSHLAEGPGLMLQPGQAHRFTFLALSHEPGGKTIPLNLGMHVWLFHRPRKRNL